MARNVPARYLQGNTVITLADLKEKPEWLELKNKVESCGCDDPSVFGGSNYGGYLLQQNAEEFSGLVYFLKNEGPFNIYVEIGSASGGNLRFIYENVGFHRAFSFDDRMHPHAVHQPSNSWHFGERVIRYAGDSHHPAASNMFSKWLDGRVIDCIFIDGDHSVVGVIQDYKMVRPHLTSRSLLIFHDTHSIPDIGIATKDLIESGEIQPVAHFVSENKPCGIMVAKFSGHMSV
jgi:hypothetical protein